MRKIIGLILLLSGITFAQTKWENCVVDSNSAVSDSIKVPGIGYVPAMILIEQGIADTITIEGKYGDTWYWLQDGEGAKYVASADSSMNMAIPFTPTKVWADFEFYRFTLNETITASGGDEFKVKFVELHE